MSDKPRRKPTRLGTPGQKPKAAAAAGKPQPQAPKRSDLFWVSLSAGIVVLAGLLIAVIYSFVPESQEESPVADNQPAGVKPKSDVPKPAAADFSERAVAEWVVSQGGRVRVLEPSGTSKEVYDSTSLPSGKFEIETMSLDGIEAATDDQIAKLWGLKTMRELGLSQTRVTDAGVVELQKLSNLNTLNLRGCPITDLGLQSLGKMTNLKMLFADAGQSAMSTVKNFNGPETTAREGEAPAEPPSTVSIKPFTDQGLKLLAGLKGLQTLSLVSDRAGDAGLASIANASRKLVQLRTVGFQISDGGVVPLKNLKDLRVLELSNSNLTDRCIDTLSQLKWLECLIVQGTRITPEGVKLLQQRLPKCKVFGGKYDPRRVAIREILLLKGKVTLTPDGQPQQVLARFEDLPEKFTVQSIDLSGVKSLKLEELVMSEANDLILTDSGVESLDLIRLPKWMPKLKNLDLAGTAVSDRECAFLVDLKDLTSIDFSRSPVTRAGAYLIARGLFNCDVLYGLPTPKADHEVAELVLKLGAQINIEEPGKKEVTISDPAELPATDFKLRYVSMTLPHLLTDEVAAKFAGLRHLRGLGASSCMMSDAGLVHFENMMNFHGMSIHHSPGPITDIGMRSLGRLPKLGGWSMHLEALQITDEGIRNLGHQPHLRMLPIGFNKITDKGLQAIADQFEGLSHLSVHGTNITDEGVTFLASGKLKHLMILELTGSKIGDESLKHLVQLPRLTWLGLSGTQVTDKGMDSLIKLQNLNNLELSGTKVTDAGMETLTAMSELVSIDINKTSVTEKGIARLREKFPKIIIADNERTFAIKNAFKYGAKLTVILKNQKREEVEAFDKLPSNSLLVHRMDFTGNEAKNGGHYVGAFLYCNLADVREIRLTKPMVEKENLGVIAGGCKDLVVLDLSQTDAIDGHLELLVNMQSLRRLDLTGTRCTKQGIKALQAKLPKCEIIGP